MRGPRDIICTDTTSKTDGQKRLLSNVAIDDDFVGVEHVFLFYGSSNSEVQDTRMTTVMDMLGDTSYNDFKQKLYAFVALYPSFPSLISVANGGLLDPSPAEIDGVLTVLAGDTWVSLMDFELTSDGYIYTIIDLYTSQRPTYYQIQQGLNASNLAPLQVNLGLKVQAGEDITINFTSLPVNTTYAVYFFTQNEDKTIFSRPSSVYAFAVNTTGTDFYIDVTMEAFRIVSSLLIIASVFVLVL